MTNDVVLNPKARAQLINEIWGSGAPRTMEALARECIAAQVFNDSERDSAFFKWARATCHDAVRKAKDASGLPLSGPTGSSNDDGEGIWSQRTLWDVDAYVHNVAGNVEAGMGHLRTAALLADECEERYGVRPDVPSI